MSIYRAARLLPGSALVIFGASAQAGTVALGEISAPMSWSISQQAPTGPLLDRFTFTIRGDEPLMFSSFVSTGYNRRAVIPDLQGELFRDDELLVTGDAQTLNSPEGFPAREVRFDAIALAWGDYELRFSGTVISLVPGVPIGAQYNGQAEIFAATAVPEPQSLALLGLGLMALAALRRRA